MFSKHTALAAVPDAIDSFSKRGRQPGRSFPIALEQMKRYALRGFLTDAWHAAQAIDQANEEW
jgi:hypothetical protein